MIFRTRPIGELMVGPKGQYVSALWAEGEAWHWDEGGLGLDQLGDCFLVVTSFL